MPARVMVFAKINRGDEEAFEAAYAEVTAKVKGTQGHITDELLRRADPPDAEDGPRTYILLSEWESRDAFLAWETEPIHMQTTTPMRPYWAGKVERIIFDVAHTIKSSS
jgi:heme oxygenase (mycobilin-producing)